MAYKYVLSVSVIVELIIDFDGDKVKAIGWDIESLLIETIVFKGATI